MKGPGTVGLLVALAAWTLSATAAAPAGSPHGEASAADVPAPSLVVLFAGPSSGRDAADPYERLAGAATGEYGTHAVSDGHGRLSGRIWLAPSVCAACVLETPLGATRERGLLGVQYSFADRDAGRLAVSLRGAVDWEVSFEHEVAGTGVGFTANDPFGPPVAEQPARFVHESRASLGNDFDYERFAHALLPVAVSYEAVPGPDTGEPVAAEPPLGVRTVDVPVADGFLRLTYRA